MSVAFIFVSPVAISVHVPAESFWNFVPSTRTRISPDSSGSIHSAFIVPVVLFPFTVTHGRDIGP